MLGDGANDALAFSRAGLRGTPVVDRGLLEQKADFYLLGRGLAGLGLLFRVVDRRAATLRAWLAMAYASCAWRVSPRRRAPSSAASSMSGSRSGQGVKGGRS